MRRVCSCLASMCDFINVEKVSPGFPFSFVITTAFPSFLLMNFPKRLAFESNEDVASQGSARMKPMRGTHSDRVCCTLGS